MLEAVTQWIAKATACLKNEDQLPLRLMFQDEARFGRMSDPRLCWAPAPHRPVVNLALVRESSYEYAAVSPWDGCLDFMTAEKMNTENMSRFLSQVSKAHKDEFIVDDRRMNVDVLQMLGKLHAHLLQRLFLLHHSDPRKTVLCCLSQ